MFLNVLNLTTNKPDYIFYIVFEIPDFDSFGSIQLNKRGESTIEILYFE